MFDLYEHFTNNRENVFHRFPYTLTRSYMRNRVTRFYL
jgi:hypothetical protein